MLHADHAMQESSGIWSQTSGVKHSDFAIKVLLPQFKRTKEGKGRPVNALYISCTRCPHACLTGYAVHHIYGQGVLLSPSCYSKCARACCSFWSCVCVLVYACVCISVWLCVRVCKEWSVCVQAPISEQVAVGVTCHWLTSSALKG